MLARAPRPDCHACGDENEASGLDRFLDWYADALLNQTPCMRMDDVAARGALIDAPGQRGVIYHTMKFCDYYGFEYLEASRTSEVPMLKIETDGTRQSAGQLSTRLKAFDETLRGMAETGGDAHAHADGPVYVLGVDSGSTSTDAVIVNGDGAIVASVIVPTGAKASAGARRAIEEVLGKAGLTDADLTLRVATGYGRGAIDGMDSAITEITCHAPRRALPRARRAHHHRHRWPGLQGHPPGRGGRRHQLRDE